MRRYATLLVDAAGVSVGCWFAVNGPNPGFGAAAAGVWAALLVLHVAAALRRAGGHPVSLHAAISDALRLASLGRECSVFTLEVHGEQGKRIAISAIERGAAVVEWRDADGVHSCQIVNGEAGPIERNETFVLDTIGGAL